MGSESPKNGIYIILGEVNYLLTAMRRNIRYAHYVSGLFFISIENTVWLDAPFWLCFKDMAQDPLIKNFFDLKALLSANTGKRSTDFIAVQ